MALCTSSAPLEEEIVDQELLIVHIAVTVGVPLSELFFIGELVITQEAVVIVIPSGVELVRILLPALAQLTLVPSAGLEAVVELRSGEGRRHRRPSHRTRRRSRQSTQPRIGRRCRRHR